MLWVSTTPHGDSAIYDTLVRMVQEFSMRTTLVDGQGNFGSIDGDSPAAMRYTEVRLAKITGQMIEDLDKETVDFVPNYDESEADDQRLIRGQERLDFCTGRRAGL